MKSIEDLADAYLKAVEPLVPPGYCPVVALLDAKGRKKKKNAAARNWDPLSGSVLITLKPDSPASRSKKAVALPTPLAEAVRALDTAEHKIAFVSLKWFRDQFLPTRGVAWAATPYVGQETVKEAIDRGLFLTSKVPNPKAPAFPVTAIRLNRDLQEVKQILGSAPVARRRTFQPVPIAG
ncbi:MAG: hypothetical protein M3N41_13390, partial [Acidobacteriota bacterium]|nr:hypothetical protein [Acidobacteriota bacterium]